MTAQLYQDWITQWDKELKERIRNFHSFKITFPTRPQGHSCWNILAQPYCPHSAKWPRDYLMLWGSLQSKIHPASNQSIWWRSYTSWDIQYQSTLSHENGWIGLAWCGHNNYLKLLAQGSDFTQDSHLLISHYPAINPYLIPSSQQPLQLTNRPFDSSREAGWKCTQRSSIKRGAFTRTICYNQGLNFSACLLTGYDYGTPKVSLHISHGQSSQSA